MFPNGTHLSAESTEAMRIKFLTSYPCDQYFQTFLTQIFQQKFYFLIFNNKNLMETHIGAYLAKFVFFHLTHIAINDFHFNDYILVHVMQPLRSVVK